MIAVYVHIHLHVDLYGSFSYKQCIAKYTCNVHACMCVLQGQHHHHSVSDCLEEGIIEDSPSVVVCVQAYRAYMKHGSDDVMRVSERL